MPIIGESVTSTPISMSVDARGAAFRTVHDKKEESYFARDGFVVTSFKPNFSKSGDATHSVGTRPETEVSTRISETLKKYNAEAIGVLEQEFGAGNFESELKEVLSTIETHSEQPYSIHAMLEAVGHPIGAADNHSKGELTVEVTEMYVGTSVDELVEAIRQKKSVRV